jgi:ribosomal protein S18 acetylase RimI-like enzyme
VGIEQEMMNEAEKQACKLGVEIVELEVHALNTHVVHIYERVDYQVTGRLQNAIKRDGEYMDTLVRIKQLPPVL